MQVADMRRAFGMLFMHNAHERHPEGMLEIIGASFVANEDSIFGNPNKDYMIAEKDWYDSQILNTNKLQDLYGKVPAIRKHHAANTRGEINSNYGWCVYSEENGSQYDCVLRELKNNPMSRRGTMIYTRPSMHSDHDRAGINDFICTNAVTYYVRDNTMYTVVQMRSNDAVFGYMNDLYWARAVAQRLACDLDENLEVADILWQAQNIHMYPRHLHHVEAWCKENM